MTSASPLTKRQKQVLGFIIDELETTGYPPTIREIGDHLGIKSTNGVNDHLKALERKEYLKREDAKSRTLCPLRHPDGRIYRGPDGEGDRQNKTCSIPVVGRIAAGRPSEAVEHVDEFVEVGQALLDSSGDDLFGLRVQGESMIEDGIHDGDYIFVKQTSEVSNGEIVAAMIDGEATVKRLYREDGALRLQPSNESMDPIRVRPEDRRDTSVLGRVVGVFRQV